MEKTRVFTQSAGSAKLKCFVQGLFGLVEIFFLHFVLSLAFVEREVKFWECSSFTRGQLLREGQALIGIV